MLELPYRFQTWKVISEVVDFLSFLTTIFYVIFGTRYIFISVVLWYAATLDHAETKTL